MFKRVMVANRGEIAVRIMRTLREMGISPVAIFSDADRRALHVRSADHAVHVGPAIARESYLNIERVIAAAKKAGAEAIHPGYGFLSENPAFAEACEAAGIVFIGPPASAMRAMGSKPAARARMIEAGVPVVPGVQSGDLDAMLAAAEHVGYPVMLKAASGGGGKGMRLVDRKEDLPAAFERAQSEALNSFGDATVYLEKAIVQPRHVEIQVLGDRAGNTVHLFERDCSVQRRNQKVVEETPSPAASAELVQRMGEVAVRAAKAVGYFSAGTCEFLLDANGGFYFLEMNTRLQVEHPVTEWITGLDLVREMVRIAAGFPLEFTQADVRRHGHSIECRVYAEDPANNFLPSPGRIETLRVPGGPFVRDDSGAYPGCEISSFYDPLVSKLSVWAPDRARAVEKMRRALSEYVVTGIRTNLPFHQKLFEHPEFVAGHYDTGFIHRHADVLLAEGAVQPGDEAPTWATALAALAATRSQQTASTAQTTTSPSQNQGLSPWVLAQRNSQLGR